MEDFALVNTRDTLLPINGRITSRLMPRRFFMLKLLPMPGGGVVTFLIVIIIPVLTFLIETVLCMPTYILGKLVYETKETGKNRYYFIP